MKALANVNFALIKYWGKKDEALKIPYQSSLSFTVNNLYTEAEVVFDENLLEDEIIINDRKVKDQRVIEHLNYIRDKFKVKLFAYVKTKNFVATAAGLASSASAFAAITYAATKALGLELTNEELSIIARRGSGSASRSIYGGFAIWNHGNNDETSYAEKLNIEWDDFRIVVCLVDTNEKKHSSTIAMQKSVLNKPLYEKWVRQSKIDLENILVGIKEKDIKKVGSIAEENALRMHKLIESTGINYLNEKSFDIIERVKQLRKNGINAYVTMDAGPNVKIITLKEDVEKIVSEFTDFETITCSKGEGVKLI